MPRIMLAEFLNWKTRRFEITKLLLADWQHPPTLGRLHQPTFLAGKACTWQSGRQPRTWGHCPPSAAPSCPTRGLVRPGYPRHWRIVAGHALHTVLADNVDSEPLDTEVLLPPTPDPPTTVVVDRQARVGDPQRVAVRVRPMSRFAGISEIRRGVSNLVRNSARSCTSHSWLFTKAWTAAIAATDFIRRRVPQFE
jgi:hypothetical protein